ncbi:hypothetical protein DV515_00016081 [Chloebia gouldiae]|uniref:Transmembrane protein 230 n=1 Tax=Chloebia gouldiae TaxID=44316 RepID=A0A3L8RTH5_CHLGU|nr:hypothetical protein DV515_00016081 [Chloebia gouldiae]
MERAGGGYRAGLRRRSARSGGPPGTMPSRTNLSAGIPSSKVKYSKLSSTDDGYIDLQFKKSPPKIPYKAIALAVVLFMIGTFLIIIGALLLAGYISKGGYRGYSYDDIPDFDD